MEPIHEDSALARIARRARDCWQPRGIRNRLLNGFDGDLAILSRYQVAQGLASELQPPLAHESL